MPEQILRDVVAAHANPAIHLRYEDEDGAAHECPGYVLHQIVAAPAALMQHAIEVSNRAQAAVGTYEADQLAVAAVVTANQLRMRQRKLVKLIEHPSGWPVMVTHYHADPKVRTNHLVHLPKDVPDADAETAARAALAAKVTECLAHNETKLIVKRLERDHKKIAARLTIAAAQAVPHA